MNEQRQNLLQPKEIVTIFNNAYRHYINKVDVEYDFIDGNKHTLLRLYELLIKKMGVNNYSFYYKNIKIHQISMSNNTEKETIDDLFCLVIEDYNRRKEEWKINGIIELKKRFGNFL